MLPAHAAFEILRPFLFAHLPPPDAQGLKGICSMRRAVMAGFVAPDALLLVPFFAIAAECLEPFTALPGIKPANRKRVSRAALMASSQNDPKRTLQRQSSALDDPRASHYIRQG